jgi:hypothetical protein
MGRLVRRISGRQLDRAADLGSLLPLRRVIAFFPGRTRLLDPSAA